MLRNLAAVAPNYRDAGIGIFVVASSFVIPAHRTASGRRWGYRRGRPSWQDIERRLALDVTSGRRDDLRDAAASTAAGEGAGVKDIVINNDRKVRTVAHEVMSWLRRL